MLDTFRKLDPRYFQIATLGALVTYGVGVLRFDVSLDAIVTIIFAALMTQLLGSISTNTAFEPRSALISALSLILLLRSNSLALLALAAMLAVGSKFVVRVRRKHLFNPTNIAIVVLLLTTNDVWVSTGQWGSAAFFGFALAAAGAFVVNRAARGDVTYAFLATYIVLIFGRALYLGDPLSIPLHKLESGALVLFSFFMISDPRTTPDHRVGRVIFAVLVAGIGWWIQTKLFRPEGLLFALAGVSLLTPLIDRLLPSNRFVWAAARAAEPQPRVNNVVSLPARSMS